MKVPFLPTKEEMIGIAKKGVNLFKGEMIITITTDNPNNRNVEEDANKLMQPWHGVPAVCYKVEVKKEPNNPTYVIISHWHSLKAYEIQQASLQNLFSKDRQLKREYPDRRIGVNYPHEVEK
jgi:hypothetical protein